MQAWYPGDFEREMGFSAAEFARCLPEAFAPAVLVHEGDAGPATGTAGSVRVRLHSGVARLAWRELAPRRIALITLPRLHVAFCFGGIDDAERQHVLVRFDRTMLRGGG